MQNKLKLALKTALILTGGLLLGWLSYWAGFSKALQIGSYINQRQDMAQAIEYDQLIAQLDSGKYEEVRSHLKGVGDILKKQASLQDAEANSILDLLFPIGGLSLLRDYNTKQAKRQGVQPNH